MDVATLARLYDAEKQARGPNAPNPALWTNTPRSALWMALDIFCEAVHRCIPSTALATVANTRGSQPRALPTLKPGSSAASGADAQRSMRFSPTVHVAAIAGQPPAVIDFLIDKCGAGPSLFVRNAAGLTPLDCARLFGPFPATEHALQAHAQRHSLRMRIRAATPEASWRRVRAVDSHSGTGTLR
mmetsp:Transcript_48404/g.96453  ORF Transcript_48404/g.96453 Transcript_48404/m.96453 type:complete len:186 (+) Transcript_48404:1199-1756(+)